MPINEYKDQIQHSLYGRKFGLDSRGFAVGIPGVRVPTEISTAPSTMTEYGLTVMTGSTAGVWTLSAPLAAGVEKVVVNASTVTTATLSVVRSTANGACSFLGTTIAGGLDGGAVRLNLLNSGAALRMISVSSAVWVPVGNINSTLYYTNSTSS